MESFSAGKEDIYILEEIQKITITDPIEYIDIGASGTISLPVILKYKD